MSGLSKKESGSKISVYLIAYSFLPKLEAEAILNSRITKFLLNDDNIEVKVFTISSSDKRLESYEAKYFVGRKFTKYAIAQKKYFLKNIIVNYLGSRILIPDGFQFYFKQVQKLFHSVFINDENHKIVFSWSSPFSTATAALRIKKAYNIPWIAHFSDPWVDNPYLKSKLIFPLNVINRKLEASVIKNADALIFVTEEAKVLTMKRYPKVLENKAHVIPHSFDSTLYPECESKNDKLIMRYIGSFYKQRNPLAIFTALSELVKTEEKLIQKIVFEIYGQESIHFDIKFWIGKYKLEKLVSYKGPVDFLTSLKLMKTADVLIAIDAPFKENVFLPSKLIDYIGSRKPILAITPNNGPTHEIIKLIRGKQAQPSDISTIKAHIMQLISDNEAGSLESLIPEEVLRKFDAKFVVEKYKVIIKKLTHDKIRDGI